MVSVGANLLDPRDSVAFAEALSQWQQGQRPLHIRLPKPQWLSLDHEMRDAVMASLISAVSGAAGAHRPVCFEIVTGK